MILMVSCMNCGTTYERLLSNCLNADSGPQYALTAFNVEVRLAVALLHYKRTQVRFGKWSYGTQTAEMRRTKKVPQYF